MIAACARTTPAPLENKGMAGFQPAQRGASVASGAPNEAADVVVRKGDTVWGIARRTGVPVRAIISANNLRAPFTLRPGQGLKVPSARRHVVQRGDTIYGISRRYGVDMASLVQLNRLKRPYTIKPSQELSLPATARLVMPPRRAEATTVPRQSSPRRESTKAVPPRGGDLFAWPVQGRIVDGYGDKGGGLYNEGVNIASKRGQPVRAADNGIVVYAGGELRGLGNLLLIRHAEGWITAYAHNESLLVGRGDVVSRGQVISRVGDTGNVRSPQLHFEIRKGTRTVNPTRYLPRLTSRPVELNFQAAGEILDELPSHAA
jgi:murein DD-endopeptidase MepM/ murein hydrolase activator NlpD